MYMSVDVMWTLMAACLVFVMQIGFAMCETGFTRAKNAGNIIMKNLTDFCIGAIMFWLIGFGLMFGKCNDLIGHIDFFTVKFTDNASTFVTYFCIFNN